MNIPNQTPFDPGLTLEAGHTLIFGATREGMTSGNGYLSSPVGNFVWLDDCGGRAGKTTQLDLTLPRSSLSGKDLS